MTLPLVILVFLIGLAVIFGGSRPVKAVAGIFLVVGIYVGTTSLGEDVASGLNELARLIG